MGDAVIAQAQAAYDATAKTRTLPVQSLHIEMPKYSVGLSVTFLPMQYPFFAAQG